MGSGVARERQPVGKAHRIAILPTTRLGRWAVGLAAAFPVLVLAWTVVPKGAAFGLACGVVGGVVALVAIFRDGERAITVFAALVPFLLALGFVLAELIVGHD